MPWIHATLSARVDDVNGLARELARAAATSAGLEPTDVVVLVTIADTSAGSGAVVTVSGRRRDNRVEADLIDSVRQVVASCTGLNVDLVAVVRYST